MPVVNWIWQGCVVAAVTAAILVSLRRCRAESRYVICGVSLVAVLLLPVTAAWHARVGPVATVVVDPVPSMAALSASDAPWTAASALAVVWAIWSSLQALHVVAAWLALRRAKRSCEPFPVQWESQLPHWQHVKGVGRRVPLMLSDRVRAAAVLGGRAPIIAVAPVLLEHLHADELDGIVIHEWAHVQRRDDVGHALQLAARVLAGWHPAVWWLNRRLQAEREHACDDVAMTITRSPRAYAASLVKVAGLPLAAAGPLPALGALSAPRLGVRLHRMTQRQAVLSPRESRRAVGASVALLVAVSSAVGGLRVAAAVVPVVALPPLPADLPVSLSSVSRGTGFASLRPVAADRVFERVTTARIVKSSPPLPHHAADRDALAASDREPVVTASVVTERAGDAAGSSALVSTPLPAVFEPGSKETPAARANGAVPSWTAAADAGRAIGQGSKNAGVATASFLSRMGKRIAGSF